MNAMTTNTDTTTDTDPASEERIEEMLEIEHDLREQYEDAQITTEDPEEDDGVADSRLDEYTGRVIDFERNELREGVKAKEIRIRILLHDGETRAETVRWPDDPTNKREPLVRLCEYVDVPIDRVAELQGEYVPMKTHDEGQSSLEIPPVPALGNNLLYRFKRLGRTNTAVRHGITTLVLGTMAFAWVPAHKLFLQVPVASEVEGVAMTLLMLGAILFLGIITVLSGLFFICVVLAVLAVAGGRIKHTVSSTLFPKA